MLKNERNSKGGRPTKDHIIKLDTTKNNQSKGGNDVEVGRQKSDKPYRTDEKLGEIAGMYQECIRREITWEELLQWNGHSDEMDIC